jgi:4'-phosphopantetheinyl transferase
MGHLVDPAQPIDPPAGGPSAPPPGRVQVWVAAGDGHAELRELLAAATGARAGELRIERGAHGRPELAEPAGSGIDFNLSHSHGVALVALATGRRVGVDVERVRPRERWPQIAARWFSGAEQEAIAALPEGERLAAFYAQWTVTEAWVKLTGTGLGHRGDPPAHAAVRRLAPAPGFAGAVAAEGSDWELDLYRVEP